MNGLDPIVEKAILPRRGSYKPERVALAAALCPEILGEKKRWTRNPQSLVEAEKIGQECGRSPIQIKAALVEWVNLSNPYETLKGLASWDVLLAAWVSSALAARVAKYTEPYEELTRDGINHVHRVVRRGVLDDLMPVTRNPSLVLEEDLQRRISSWYDDAEDASTEEEALRLRQKARAAIVPMSSLAILTSNPKTTIAKAIASQAIGAAWRTLMEIEGMSESDAGEELKALMANAIVNYPLQYTGGSGATWLPSSLVRDVRSILAGAVLGSVAMHVVLKNL